MRPRGGRDARESDRGHERAVAVTDRHVRSVSAIEAAQYVPGNGKIVV